LFACRLPCEARNAEVGATELTTAILVVGLFKICQLRTNHCLTHTEAQIKVLPLIAFIHELWHFLRFTVSCSNVRVDIYILCFNPRLVRSLDGCHQRSFTSRRAQPSFMGSSATSCSIFLQPRLLAARQICIVL